MPQQDSHARLLSAYADMNAGRYVEARSAFEALVKEGESKALVYLGWMDEQGLGSPPDEAMAATRYAALSQEGNSDAAYYAASLKLKQGDIAGALKDFLRAADANHPSAAYWASAIYSGERGFPIDPIKAMAYLTKAASLGHVFAQRDLAKQRMHDSGTIFTRAGAALSYLGAKLKGIIMIARNVNDPRVR